MAIIVQNQYEGKIPSSVQPDPELYKSSLGTPVKTNIIFKSVTYTDQRTKQKITTPEITYDTILITCNRPKKIVKTEIDGRPGTVKEYIGMDDYQVQINGIITAANGVHPATEISRLQQMIDAPVPIPVVSSYLNNLGIYELVFEDCPLEQEPGGYSKQSFSLSAISNDPIELQIL